MKTIYDWQKDWMFSATPEGASASANIYGLVETAKANGLEPFEYLNKVFKKLPMAQTEQDFLELLQLRLKTRCVLWIAYNISLLELFEIKNNI